MKENPQRSKVRTSQRIQCQAKGVMISQGDPIQEQAYYHQNLTRRVKLGM